MAVVNYKEKKSPKLDMNPMVDLAFLLVTFFMLTTTFKANNPFEISNPSSNAELKMPSQNLLLISIDREGKVYAELDGKNSKAQFFNLIANELGVTITPEQTEQFSLLNSVGLPISALPLFLEATPEARKSFEQTGIPTDSLNNELRYWIIYARAVNPMVRIAINADKKTPFLAVNRVIKTLTTQKVHRFNLITDKELTALQ